MPSLLPTLVLAAATAEAALQFFGNNIDGFDFGCDTEGTCDLDTVLDPIADLGAPNAEDQMQHFVDDDGFNTFRLPVGWQFLVNNQLGGDLDEDNFAAYDTLVQACLDAGAACIVDVHNFARFNGDIVGQSDGAVTDDDLVSLWSQLAKKYGDNTNILFGLMNEPHDLDMDIWGETMQAVVTAVREDAPNNILLLPGTNFTSAQTFPDESAPALLKVTNPDGSTDNLVFDVHKYLDEDNSGTHTECVTDNIDDTFQPLVDFLEQEDRVAMLTETGGGNEDSCSQFLCDQLDFIDDNSDRIIGVTTFAAGGFDQAFNLTETPVLDGNKFVDSSLVTDCIANRKTGKAKKVNRRLRKAKMTRK